MPNEIVEVKMDSAAIEQVLLGGDLSKLAPHDRVQFYQKVCSSLGLNPLTKPFEYTNLNGKLTLYAKKDAADQLRKINDVSIDDIDMKETDETYFVKVKGHNKSGRTDVEIGVVMKKDMQGNIANAQMKAVTKAKRRLTLSLCGLGWLDETEVETIPTARPVKVADTGEILEGHVEEPHTVTEAVKNMAQENPVQPAERPYTPSYLKHIIAKKVDTYVVNPDTMPTFKDTWRGSVVATIEKEIAGYVQDKAEVRRAILQYLVGKDHSNDMEKEEVVALWKWLGVTKVEEVWTTNEFSVKEIRSLVEFLAPVSQ